MSKWSNIWVNILPKLALLGPLLWFIAALIRSAGFGLLPGELSWSSAPEAVVMIIGSPFFVATFIYLGHSVARVAPRTGIFISIFGVLGTAFFSFVSGLRALAIGFLDYGFEADKVNEAIELAFLSHWLSPLLIYNLGQFLVWIVAGVCLLRRRIAPWWAGVFLILGVPCMITAQALYIKLELFYPLATGFWLLGVWGVTRSADK